MCKSGGPPSDPGGRRNTAGCLSPCGRSLHLGIFGGDWTTGMFERCRVIGAAVHSICSRPCRKNFHRGCGTPTSACSAMVGSRGEGFSEVVTVHSAAGMGKIAYSTSLFARWCVIGYMRIWEFDERRLERSWTTFLACELRMTKPPYTIILMSAEAWLSMHFTRCIMELGTILSVVPAWKKSSSISCRRARPSSAIGVEPGTQGTVWIPPGYYCFS